MSILKNLFKDTALYGIGKSFQKFIGIFLLPLYATVLTPEDFGVLDTIGVSTFFFIAILNLGLDSASGRFFFSAKTEDEKGKILFTTLVIRLITLIPILILACFSSQISVLLFNDSSYKWLVLVSILIIPMNVMYSDQENIFRYYFESYKYNQITIFKVIFSAASGLFLVIYLNYGAFGAVLSSFISFSISLFITFYFFNKKRYVFHFSWEWAKKLINYGLPLIWATAAIWFYSSSDRYIILHFHNLTEVGIFSISSKIVQVLAMLNIAIQMSFGPHMVNNYEQDKTTNKLKSKNFMSDSWHVFLYVSITIIIVLSIFCPNIILFMLNEEYLTASLAVPFLGFSKILSQSIQMATPGILLKNKTKYFGIILPICAFLNIIINFILIPRFGFTGAAFSTFLIHVLQFSILFFISQKLLYVDYKILLSSLYILIGILISIIIPLYEIFSIFKFSILQKTLICIIASVTPMFIINFSFGNFFKVLTNRSRR